MLRGSIYSLKSWTYVTLSLDATFLRLLRCAGFLAAPPSASRPHRSRSAAWGRTGAPVPGDSPTRPFQRDLKRSRRLGTGTRETKGAAVGKEPRNNHLLK